MHNICPTLAPSPTVTALSKEIFLDYGTTDCYPSQLIKLNYFKSTPNCAHVIDCNSDSEHNEDWKLF